MVRTLEYTATGFLGAAPLGLVLAPMRLNHLGMVRGPAAVYTEVFQNVALLAIILVN